MIGGLTRHMLPHLSGVPHLHVNRPLVIIDVVSDYPLRITILKYRTKTRKPQGWTIISLGGGGRGLRSFLLQFFFEYMHLCNHFFFQSHHHESNFYLDFFFGAKTINRQKECYRATYFVQISS